jgi:hypothetical protein
MSAREKSDLPVVAEKRANKAASAAAELVERRGGAKENAELQSTVRTQSREAVSQAQARIREAVARNRQDKLTALLHHLSVDVLRASFFGLKKSAVPGVDEMTWTEYAEGLEENLSVLHSRVQTGAYRALPSRRTYIPKADGRQRPLGIAALEDKIVQAAMMAILTPIYEAEFQLDVAAGRQPLETWVTVNLNDTFEACQMRSGTFGPIGTVEVDGRRRIGAAPRPIVTGIDPEPAGLGAATAGIEHRDRCVVSEQRLRGKDVLGEPGLQRLEPPDGPAHPVGGVERSSSTPCRAKIWLCRSSAALSDLSDFAD